mmetsp:Transcript_40861/g.94831  ORF Transcript_40861/g.94831 Transcript_40861/m.94831 type:complete len:279 (-) Transcript_40861:942-1778(-)
MLLTPMKALPIVGCVQLAAQSCFQQEVQSLTSIETFKELDNEEGIGHEQNILLVHDAFLHAHLHNKAFGDAFHGIGLFGVPVLPKLNGGEAAAAEQADADQILALDAILLPPLLGPRPAFSECRASLVALFLRFNDVLEGAEKQVESDPVQHQSLRLVRNHRDGSRPRLVAHERTLAKKVGQLRSRGSFELCLLFTVLRDLHLALVEDVEGASRFALLQNDLAFGKVHLYQSLRQRSLFLCQQRFQNAHTVQIHHVLRDLVVRHLHQDALETDAINHP